MPKLRWDTGHNIVCNATCRASQIKNSQSMRSSRPLQPPGLRKEPQPMMLCYLGKHLPGLGSLKGCTINEISYFPVIRNMNHLVLCQP